MENFQLKDGETQMSNVWSHDTNMQKFVVWPFTVFVFPFVCYWFKSVYVRLVAHFCWLQNSEKLKTIELNFFFILYLNQFFICILSSFAFAFPHRIFGKIEPILYQTETRICYKSVDVFNIHHTQCNLVAGWIWFGCIHI